MVFHALPGLTHVLLAEPKRLPLLVEIVVEGERRSANGKNAIKLDSFLA